MKNKPNLTSTMSALAQGVPASNPQRSLWGDDFTVNNLPAQGRMNRDEYMSLVSAIGASGEAFVVHSYQTPVVWFMPGRGWQQTSKTHSKTTTRHINALMKQIRG